MNFVKNILGGSLGETADKISVAVKRFVTTDKDRMELNLELNRILVERDKVASAEILKELEAKERFIVAELQQGDVYTKRTRPMVIRWGLYLILWNHGLYPAAKDIINAIASVAGSTLTASTEIKNLPYEFWWAWGGLVGSYMLGRTLEKSGVGGKVVNLLTGGKLKP